MIIYIIENKINGKCYIGKTKQTLQKRWNRHKYLAKKKENRYLYNAMNEYGITNFHPSVLEYADNCSDEYLSEREIYWISKYNSNNILYGYNMTKGGTGGDVISSHPNRDEIVKKISDKNRGKKRTLEQKMKMSSSKIEYYKNNKVSEATRLKMSNAVKRRIQDGSFKGFIHRKTGKEHPFYGKRHSIESRKKMSDFRKGKSYEQIMGVEKATSLKALRSEKWLGNLNPSYKDIDKEELKEMVDKGYSNIELAEYFLVSRQTISSKFKSFFGMTLTEYRKINNLPIRRKTK